MKNKILKLVVYSLLLSTFCFAGKGGDGVGGGGNSIETKGGRAFRDRLDPSVCIWYSGSSFVSKFSPLTWRLLNSLKKMNALYSYRMGTELDRLSFCLTKDLKSVPTEDPNSTTYYMPKHVRQAAVRQYDIVFVDRNELKQMRLIDRAALTVHEVTHSFIAMSVDRRNEKVRSATKMILENYTNIMDKQDFDRGIIHNEVQIPTSIYGDVLGEALNPTKLDQNISNQLKQVPLEVYASYLNEAELQMIANKYGVTRAIYTNLISKIKDNGLIENSIGNCTLELTKVSLIIKPDLFSAKTHKFYYALKVNLKYRTIAQYKSKFITSIFKPTASTVDSNLSDLYLSFVENEVKNGSCDL